MVRDFGARDAHEARHVRGHVCRRASSLAIRRSAWQAPAGTRVQAAFVHSHAVTSAGPGRRLFRSTTLSSSGRPKEEFAADVLAQRTVAANRASEPSSPNML